MMLQPFIQKRLLGDSRNVLVKAKEVGINGTLWSAPMIPFAIANAPRGYKVSDGVSTTITELAIAPAVSTIAYIALGTLFPELGVGLLVQGAIGLASSGISHYLGERLNRSIRTFKDFEVTQRKMNLGFQDSLTTQNYRQQAIQEMSGAFSNRRR